MRIAIALAFLCLALPAWAQGPAGKPVAAQSPQGEAAAGGSGRAAMPLADRIAIQSDLIWTGDLNSIADGEWGARSTAAVKAFQKRKGGKETGVLTPEERTALAAEAKAGREEVGWRVITDESGARLGIPAKLVPRMRKGRSGGSWQSARGDVQIDVLREPAPATLAVLYEQQRKNPARKIEYSVRRPEFFVISGTQGAKKFYMRMQAGPKEVRGFAITYDPAMEDVMGRMVVAVSSAFTAFPAPVEAAGRPAPRRKVEYATGVIVSAAGDIVTDRESIDGCEVIVVAGLGNAARIADDRDAGLALIRIYGAQGLKRMALGADLRSEVTLVGVADPQVQSGKAAVSAAKARVTGAGENAALETPATPGFQGAAAIDADTGFVGVVVQKRQLVAGPAAAAASAALATNDAIRKLLVAQNVSPASGRMSAAAAQDSVVRVICVRK